MTGIRQELEAIYRGFHAGRNPHHSLLDEFEKLIRKDERKKIASELDTLWSSSEDLKALERDLADYLIALKGEANES